LGGHLMMYLVATIKLMCECTVRTWKHVAFHRLVRTSSQCTNRVNISDRWASAALPPLPVLVPAAVLVGRLRHGRGAPPSSRDRPGRQSCLGHPGRRLRHCASIVPSIRRVAPPLCSHPSAAASACGGGLQRSFRAANQRYAPIRCPLLGTCSCIHRSPPERPRLGLGGERGHHARRSRCSSDGSPLVAVAQRRFFDGRSRVVR
jgi:hypothetical protein